MFKSAFYNAIYDPLYNGLVYLVDIVPAHDIGIAIIPPYYRRKGSPLSPFKTSGAHANGDARDCPRN